MSLKIVDPYLIFTTIVVCLGVGSAFLAPSIDLAVLILAALTILLGMYGSHFLDMIHGGYKDASGGVLWAVAVTTLSLGVILGVVLAWMTTWWFLVLVASGAFCAVAYNYEIFGGAFRDPEYRSYLTFAYSWGFVPSFGASVLMDNVKISTSILALGVGMFVVPLLMWFEASKPMAHTENPFIDNPHRGMPEMEAKKLTYQALLIIVVSIWVLTLALALHHYGL